MKLLDLAELDLYAPTTFTERKEGTVKLKVKSRTDYTPVRRFFALVGFVVVSLAVLAPIVHGAILFIGDVRSIV